MRDRRQLGKRLLGLAELLLGLVEPALLEQRAAEHELRVADLVEHVVAAAENLERVPRLLLGRAVVAGAQVHLRERRDRGRRVLVASDLERDREGVLQMLDRLLGLAEQELEPAEVVQQAADVDAVGELLVLVLRPLRVRAREHPVAAALGEHRGLEVRLAERATVLQRVGELERALDVLARSLVVALAPVAARAPGERREAELVARQTRALGERRAPRRTG